MFHNFFSLLSTSTKGAFSFHFCCCLVNKPKIFSSFFCSTLPFTHFHFWKCLSERIIILFFCVLYASKDGIFLNYIRACHTVWMRIYIVIRNILFGDFASFPFVLWQVFLLLLYFVCMSQTPVNFLITKHISSSIH